MGELNEDYYVVTHEPQYTDRARTDDASLRSVPTVRIEQLGERASKSMTPSYRGT